MGKELPIEEVTEVEVFLYVKWYGNNVSVVTVDPRTSSYIPQSDEIYKIRLPIPPQILPNQ